MRLCHALRCCFWCQRLLGGGMGPGVRMSIISCSRIRVFSAAIYLLIFKQTTANMWKKQRYIICAKHFKTIKVGGFAAFLRLWWGRYAQGSLLCPQPKWPWVRVARYCGYQTGQGWRKKTTKIWGKQLDISKNELEKPTSDNRIHDWLLYNNNSRTKVPTEEIETKQSIFFPWNLKDHWKPRPNIASQSSNERCIYFAGAVPTQPLAILE